MTLRRWREHPAARVELREAALWYDNEEAGLGEQFADEMETAVDFIREWPESAQPYHGRRRFPVIRRRGIDVFPYGIVYFVRDDEATIIAYAHAKRRPGYWRSRLKDL